MASADYLALCDRLFRDWMDGAEVHSQRLAQLFTLQHGPEPYLLFGEGSPSCVFVTTNPGKGFPYQLRSSTGPGGAYAEGRPYREIARVMGAFYAAPRACIAPTARTNIAAMRRIGGLFGATSVMQVEALPWHSPSLPRKDLLAELREVEPLYAAYHGALRRFLADKPTVLAWSAGIPIKRGGSGVTLKADLVGLDLTTADLLVLDRKSGVSQALLWGRSDIGFRGVFVTQGNPQLPKAGPNRSGQVKDGLIATVAGMT